MAHFQQAQATNYRTLLDALRDFASSDHVDTVAVNAGGTGYTLGDILTVAGGTFFLAATIEVTGESAGVITAVEIRQSGGYTANPSTPNSVTGGTGTGATIDLTFSGILWTVNRDEIGNHQVDEIEVLLQGVGSGSDDIFVGIRSYFNSGGDARNWEMGGFTGFTGALTWENQPGKYPGDFTNTITAAIMPLANAAIDYWFNVTGRRIIVIAKIGSAFSSGYVGFINPFATATEWPYPLAVFGCSNRIAQRFTDTFIGYSSISDPIKQSTNGSGPGFIRLPDGEWLGIFNSEISGVSRLTVLTQGVHPAVNPVNPSGTINQWYVTSTVNDFSQFIPSIGVPGVPSKIWAPTPNAAGDLYPTWPCTLMRRTGTNEILGELDDVRWFPASVGPVIPEDTLENDTFTVFQSGNRSEPWALFMIRTRNP